MVWGATPGSNSCLATLTLTLLPTATLPAPAGPAATSSTDSQPKKWPSLKDLCQSHQPSTSPFLRYTDWLKDRSEAAAAATATRPSRCATTLVWAASVLCANQFMKSGFIAYNPVRFMRSSESSPDPAQCFAGLLPRALLCHLLVDATILQRMHGLASTSCSTPPALSIGTAGSEDTASPAADAEFALVVVVFKNTGLAVKLLHTVLR